MDESTVSGGNTMTSRINAKLICRNGITNKRGICVKPKQWYCVKMGNKKRNARVDSLKFDNQRKRYFANIAVLSRRKKCDLWQRVQTDTGDCKTNCIFHRTKIATAMYKSRIDDVIGGSSKNNLCGIEDVKIALIPLSKGRADHVDEIIDGAVEAFRKASSLPFWWRALFSALIIISAIAEVQND